MTLSVMHNLHPAASSRLQKTSSRQFSGLQMQTHALLSINPRYAEAIFRRQKRYEFRRTIFRRDVRVVVVYTTSPVSMVVGEFDVQRVISDDVASLWKRTQSEAGIDCDRFFEYFAGCDIGHAIAIGEVRRYPKPLNLLQTFGLRAPQSFVDRKGAVEGKR